MYVVRGNIAECTVFTPPATMQPERPLFRTEAAAANRGTWLGEIILIRPLSFRLITVATCILTLLLAALLRYGTYTQRNTVEGHLIPDKGLIRTYPPQVAIVVEKHVSEGQQVNRGDTLFVLSTERQNSSKQETYATIGLQVELRQQSLQSELKKTQQLQQEEQQGSAQKIALIKAELNKLASQISGQQLRVQLSEENVARYRNLFAQHYISKEMLQQKQIDLLDQRNRLQSLERDHIISKRQLASEQHALSALVLQQQNQRAQMDRSLSQSQQEFIENEAKRQLTVKAFSDGIATGVTAELGQTVDTGKPLLSLIPRDAQLLAELYVQAEQSALSNLAHLFPCATRLIRIKNSAMPPAPSPPYPKRHCRPTT